MRLLFVSLSVLMVLGLVSVLRVTAQDVGSGIVVDVNTVKENQTAILTCALNFTDDGMTAFAILLRIQQKGASDLNAEKAHDFAAGYFRRACQDADCSAVANRVVICSQLASYGNLNF